MSVLGRVERVPCRAQCSPLVVSKEMKTLYQPTEDVLLSVLSGKGGVGGMIVAQHLAQKKSPQGELHCRLVAANPRWHNVMQGVR